MHTGTHTLAAIIHLNPSWSLPRDFPFPSMPKSKTLLENVKLITSWWYHPIKFSLDIPSV